MDKRDMNCARKAERGEERRLKNSIRKRGENQERVRKKVQKNEVSMLKWGKMKPRDQIVPQGRVSPITGA